ARPSSKSSTTRSASTSAPSPCSAGTAPPTPAVGCTRPIWPSPPRSSPARPDQPVNVPSTCPPPRPTAPPRPPHRPGQGGLQPGVVRGGGTGVLCGPLAPVLGQQPRQGGAARQPPAPVPQRPVDAAPRLPRRVGHRPGPAVRPATRPRPVRVGPGKDLGLRQR